MSRIFKVALCVLGLFAAFEGCKKGEKKPSGSEVSEADMITYDMALQKDDKICVLKYSDMKLDSIAMGSDPWISADGKKIAFTDYSNNKRRVVIYNFTTKQKLPVNIPSDNNYGPVWSPDSYLLAFNVFKNHNWYIGVINKENSIFKYITDRLPRGAYSPSWLSDSKRLIVHDLDKIYIFDLDGNILKTFEVEEVAKNNSVSSSTRFIMTQDEKNLIFSAGVDEDADFEEPPEAIFIYNIDSKKITRLSPKGMYCAEPVLNSSNELLFSGSTSMDDPWSIYKMKLGGGKPELYIKDATMPSVRK